jgi:hypothetical protein
MLVSDSLDEGASQLNKIVWGNKTICIWLVKLSGNWIGRYVVSKSLRIRLHVLQYPCDKIWKWKVIEHVSLFYHGKLKEK